MKNYIMRNKATLFSLGFAGAFMSVITAAAFFLGEVSPAAIF